MTSSTKGSQKKRTSYYIYQELKGYDKDTALAFKALYNHVEFGEAIPDEMLQRFIKCGIYFPKSKKIENPEDGIGLGLQALLYEGKIQKKCPNGKVYSV